MAAKAIFCMFCGGVVRPFKGGGGNYTSACYDTASVSDCTENYLGATCSTDLSLLPPEPHAKNACFAPCSQNPNQGSHTSARTPSFQYPFTPHVPYLLLG